MLARKVDNCIINSSLSPGTRKEIFILRKSSKSEQWVRAERWEETKRSATTNVLHVTSLRYCCIITALFLRYDCVITALVLRFYRFFSALLPRYYYTFTAFLLRVFVFRVIFVQFFVFLIIVDFISFQAELSLLEAPASTSTS